MVSCYENMKKGSVEMVLSVEMTCFDFIGGNEQDYFLTLTSNFLKSPLVAWKQVMEIHFRNRSLYASICVVIEQTR